MYYGEIKKFDISNGEGVRVSIFVSGCRVHCPGCFNKCTWDFQYGKLFTEETENEITEALSKEFISGLTVLGGEPFEPENQEVLVPFLSKVKKMFPRKQSGATQAMFTTRTFFLPTEKNTAPLQSNF